MKLEDDYLFPRLNSYLGIDINSGLTAMAKRDHLIILKLLTFTEEAEKARDIKKAILTGRHLDRALKKHREREQMIQYPVSDVFIERDEWEIMLIKIYGKNWSIKKKSFRMQEIDTRATKARIFWRDGGASSLRYLLPS